ncbi:hypothetical protein PHAVU_001G255100 [Phaseolus vulgaris]|uniref:Uncharacterized protein n=1 Tax=Phaseolus vulgaris TaxID=3885 RepID=V7D2F0_PHAVU|nr:hypothetical protein PHAVU_001G255100g [Phaseolus vulgaris]ESW35675.1 hypothetical protein PHAVU_001G255100g [Phaseolus vulgaris]
MGSQYRGWCPSNDYHVHEVTGPALRKRSDRPLHQKGRVAFKSILEEPITVAAEAAPVPDNPVPQTHHETPTATNHASGFRSVDQKADAFIKREHRRIELARLKSLGQV